MMHTTQNRIIAGSRILALGMLLAALMAAFMLLASSQAHASTTFTVNSTGDKGDLTSGNGECYTGDDLVVQGKECTLRAAIQEANATTGADTINFDIPTTGVATITPASQLPTITGPVNINGYSQPGASPNTKAVGSDAVLKIMLSGTGAPGANGLVMGGANSTVKGLVINRWNVGIGIDGSDATGNRITGNYLGTDASGTQELGNGLGVRVYYGSNNTIGGTTPAARNVISGNGHSGIGLGDSGVVKSNEVVGNYIGTDVSGTKDLGNTYYGVYAEDAPNTTIGGATAAERNIISGNDRDGIAISSNGNRVTGNFIGTDATGTKDLGNNLHGVDIHGPSNTVGGTSARERNVISGNGGSGVVIEGANATGNKVSGNYLGIDKNGAPLGNAANGVFIYDAPNNTVGGTTAGAGNVISANAGSGVSVFGSTATGDRVLSNSIFANGGLGIDLGDDGRTANDADDPDTGPNNLQNHPVLTSARKGATGTTTVKGTLDSAPDKTFRVQFFSNPEGTDEGKTFLGSTSVSTEGSVDASFTFSTEKAISLGQNITATATSPAGDTSEFSVPKKVVAR